MQFFRQLGYDFTLGMFGESLTQLATQAGKLSAAARLLAEATGEGGTAAAIANMLSQLGMTVDAIRQFHVQLKAEGGVGIPNIDDFPRRLTDFLILDYFDRQKPQLHETLLLLGLIEHEPDPAPDQSMRLINWQRLEQFLNKPSQIANDLYQWNTAFNTDKFLARLEGLMRAAILPGGLYPPADSTKALLGNTSLNLQELRLPLLQKGLTSETYSQFGVTFSPAEAQGRGKPKGIALLSYLTGAAQFDFAVCDQGELVFESKNADIKGMGLVIRPPANVESILSTTANFRTAVQIREKSARAEEIILVGSKGGTRLSVQGLGITWFAQNLQGKTDLGLEAMLQTLRLVIAPSESDGFLGKVLSGLNLKAEASLGLGITLLSGVTLQGGAKLALAVSTHIDLGPVKIQGLRLALAPTKEKFRLETGVVFQFDLGPLKAVVENIGLQSDLQFRPGNLGSAQLDISFKPPNGVGLSIDAGVVKGGGYLYFDVNREEYAGALELVFSGFLNLKAIGLITTKMPDGSKGFSLLIIITAEFATGIQLGFGFTLLAVGGLIGLHRTVRLQPLAEGVRTGTINNILFPKDVIANAPRIISDLRTIFPPEEGKFLIGPMAKLGWGTPPLISLSLGIIIEIPGNIAILGVLRVALPTDELPLILMQVNFIGAIEFDKQRAFFFASVFESRILFITIEGEMGVLVAWGSDSNFVVSVGGFHPQFVPPPLPFPSPKRISLNILNESWGRIRIMGYFAVTSNTVQLGAKAELFFGFSKFKIEGHLAFDVLFQFDPFYFIIEISCGVSLKAFGVGLFSISLRFSLEGPTPWRAKGYGKLKVLFFSIKVNFDFTWGEAKNTTLPPIEVLPILQSEFEKLSNWKAQLPASTNLLVSLVPVEAGGEELVLHPVGTLTITQRAVPLNLKLDKVGNQRPSDGDRFYLEVTSGLRKLDDLSEQFAIAQFQDFKDAEKLSQAAFQPENSGLSLAVTNQAFATGKAIKRNIRYETHIIDRKFLFFFVAFFEVVNRLFTHFLNGSAVTKLAVSQHQRKQLQPFDDKIVLTPEQFVVASTVDNRVASQQMIFTSEAKAKERMQQEIAQDATRRTLLHVIPAYEVNSRA